MTDTENSVYYEQPLNERVRTFLRLEFLFAEFRHHRADTTEWGNRSSVDTLLDILNLLSRSDLKKEIIKELGDQHSALMRLESRDDVDIERLRGTLSELESVMETMQHHASRAARVSLRDNEFLHAIANRSAIPGGTCVFDLPVYHHWLNANKASIDTNIGEWSGEFQPVESAIQLFLRLIRQSAAFQRVQAEAGIYLHSLEQPVQLVRVILPRGLSVYPEISAGRHRFSVRFLEHGECTQRDSQFRDDIDFDIALCSL